MALSVNAQITELYMAYFNRAPDVAGLNYWAGQVKAGLPLTGVAASFTAQPEYASVYPSSLTDSTSFVQSIYQNLFGRAPEQAGLTYWVQQLDGGAVSRSNFVLAVATGAQDTALGNDKTLIETRANAISYAIEQSAAKGVNAVTAYNTAAGADAKLSLAEFDLAFGTSLSTITGKTVTAADLAAATAAVDVKVAAIDPIVFNKAADYVGSQANDVIDTTAGADKLAGDGTDAVAYFKAHSINGNAGNDTLVISAADAAAVSVTTETLKGISSVEALKISTALSTTVDAAKFGVNSVELAFAAAAGAEVKLANNGTLTLDGATNTVKATIAGADTGTADVLNLVMKGAAANVDVSNIETLNVNVATGAVVTLANDAKVSGVVVTGNGSVTVVETGGAAKLASVDASALKGGLTFDASTADAKLAAGLTIKGGLGVNDITGSKFADTIVLNAATVGGTNKVAAGAGADNITASKGVDTFAYHAGDSLLNSNDTITGFTSKAAIDTAKAADANVVIQAAADVLDLSTVANGATAVQKLLFADGTSLSTALSAGFANDGSAKGIVSWFQLGSDTYVTVDGSADAAFNATHDVVIKLAGLVDLSDASNFALV